MWGVTSDPFFARKFHAIALDKKLGSLPVTVSSGKIPTKRVSEFGSRRVLMQMDLQNS